MVRLLQIALISIGGLIILATFGGGVYSVAMTLIYAYQGLVQHVDSALNLALWWLMVSAVWWFGGLGIGLMIGAALGMIGAGLDKMIKKGK
jgi:hypothetical protein